jgi:glycerophosphoryl diester phosphodiesterase
MTLEELAEFNYGTEEEPAELLELSALIALTLDWSARPVKLFIETKHPVRFGGLVESKVLAELQRFGIAAPPSADHSRAVVMSFSAGAVWRIRRSAPMLPTVLLGESARYLGGGAATTVGATAVGPSVKTLHEHPDMVDKAAAAGRATYCWTVDNRSDVELCRELGVSWVATNHPGRTKKWLAS